MNDLKNMKRRYTRPGQALPRLADKGSAPAETVKLEDVRTDGGTQPRESMDMDLVADYASRMVWDEGTRSAKDPEGSPWPEITVFDDGQHLWLADGFHRLHAALKANLVSFQATIKEGNLEQATLHSLGANASHGKRRTQADIKRVIERVLTHDEWSRRSNSWLAKICKVSDGTIGRHRERLERAREIPFHTSLESTNTAYYDREPPYALDKEGFLIVPEEADKKSQTPKEPVKAKALVEASFLPPGVRDAEVIVAFPSSARDCSELAASLDTAPELVIIPINANTPMAYDAPRAMHRLVEELEMIGPRPLWIGSHQRHYFIWSAGDTELSGSIEDIAKLLKGKTLVVCGQALGGWSDLVAESS